MEGASAAGAKVLGPHSASFEQDSENLKLATVQAS